ncbi:MAG: CRTAC1 family protein [Planctomycetaceae bacterium]
MSLAFALVLLGCRDGIVPPEGSPAAADRPAAPHQASTIPPAQRAPAEPLPLRLQHAIRLSDVGAQFGLDFAYQTGATGKLLMVESMGGGCGWLDFDRDGRLDLYLCQGGDPLLESEAQPLDALLRQAADGRFVDVAQNAGVVERRYGQGVSIADFDEDGFDDVYVSNVGVNRLYRNLGDGTLEDVTAIAGVGDPHWSTSTAWGDLDGDGDLDLYVCNYADYDVRDPRICTDSDGQQAVCDPLEVGFQRDTCYENLGDGRFADVTEVWGFSGTDDRSLGVVLLDLSGDGRQDVFVANDVTANFLYVRDGAGFRESGVIAGVAMNSKGDYQASMGVAVGDYDADGLPDLYCTHFTDDSNTLYRNLGSGHFEDLTRFIGLHQPTLNFLGFGTVFEDFNADGRQDLFVTNGHIADWRAKGQLLKMPPQLFTWDGSRFVELTEELGDYRNRKVLGRAVARADYDGDGDPDLAVVHQGEPAALLRNDSERGRWLKLQFIGRQSNRKAIGVQVAGRCGETLRTGWLAGGSSYCCSHEPAVWLGFGEADGPCALTVRWPSGVVQEVKDVLLDQSLTLTEPDGSEEDVELSR